MSDLQVLIKRLDPGVPLPKYSKGGDAGADIVTRIDLTLEPGERALAPTGIELHFLMVMPPLRTRVQAWQSSTVSLWSIHQAPLMLVFAANCK